MSKRKYRRSVRLSDPQRDELLDELDASPRSIGTTRQLQSVNRRLDRRHEFRRDDLIVIVEHPGGGELRAIVPTRNLSVGGLSFLHGGYVHIGSRCRTLLRTLAGEACIVDGSVASCRLIQGTVHEVGVRFAERIELRDFLGENADDASDEPNSRDLLALRGRLLYAGDADSDARLLQHHIRSTGIELIIAPTHDEAIDTVNSQPLDIILVALHARNTRSEELIAVLRGAGFTGPIVAVGGEGDDPRVETARAAGASEILARPYDTAALFDLLFRLHEQVGAAVPQQAIFSTLEEQPETTELIEQFIDETQRSTERLEEAAADARPEEIRALCLDLRGSGASYGFAQLAEAADSVLAAIDAECSVEQAAAGVRRLVLLTQNLAVRRRHNTG